MYVNGLRTMTEKSRKGKVLSELVDTYTRSGNGRKVRDSVDRWVNSKKVIKRREQRLIA